MRELDFGLFNQCEFYPHILNFNQINQRILFLPGRSVNQPARTM